ncbi:MAG: LysM peptidoglycan-binding domain-containing protein [Desulfobacteraceae bacterium]|nr:MAG: LysM peptidoglycan-binding domain-containing protein [Desulfobacteraceae bacterium]
MDFMQYVVRISLVLSLILFSSAEQSLFAQEKQEETYSISLVQAAETGREVKEIDGRKILTESYEVKSGDHLWKILRERGLLQKQNLQDVLQVLKRLNPSLNNLDLLHPGETIAIPLVLSPAKEGQRPVPKTREPPVPLENLKEADIDLYTIRPGDSLIKVIKSRYNLEDRVIHDEYLNLLKKLNPTVEDLHLVVPGQKIRFPIFSPQVVRMPLPSPPVDETKPEAAEEPPFEFMPQVASVFKEMGVDWVGAGQHFIPLDTGGQISLNADSFPIINLPHGRQVIVDSRGTLPEKMANLITSSWENYKIVRLRANDGLRGAIGKILAACGYPKVYRGNEELELPGRIPVRIKADWIVKTQEGGPAGIGKYAVLTLMDAGPGRTAPSLKRLLNEMGIRVVEYPFSGERPEASPPRADTLRAGAGIREALETVFRLTGTSFSKEVEIPVFQSRKSEFNLMIKADFLLSGDGRERIIDLTGLGPEVVSLLKDHRFEVLTLADRSDPASVILKGLDFAGVPVDSKSHTLLAAERDESRNISLTVPGFSFSATDGRRIFVPASPLPEVLQSFLSAKGYRILDLS